MTACRNCGATISPDEQTRTHPGADAPCHGPHVRHATRDECARAVAREGRAPAWREMTPDSALD